MGLGRKLAGWFGGSSDDSEGSYPSLADDVGLMTQNGFTVLLCNGSALPARFCEFFSTQNDGQAVMPVEFFRRDPNTGDAESLGKLVIDGIASAPAGVPELEVSLNVDRLGRVRASSIEVASGRACKAELASVRVSRQDD